MTQESTESEFSMPLNAPGRTALDKVEATRGYTLPYHRLFAAHAPTLLTTYDAFYQSLTIASRELSPYERETVWASLLAAAREAHGFIHMHRARDAGLTDDDLARCVAIAALCDGFSLYTFAGDNWATWTTPASLQSRYHSVFESTVKGMPVGLAHLAAMSAMVARRDHLGFVFHLSHALNGGINHSQITEALSYVLVPCGANVLLDAVAAWEAAAAEGAVAPPY